MTHDAFDVARPAWPELRLDDPDDDVDEDDVDEDEEDEDEEGSDEDEEPWGDEDEGGPEWQVHGRA